MLFSVSKVYHLSTGTLKVLLLFNGGVAQIVYRCTSLSDVPVEKQQDFSLKFRKGRL